MSRRHAYALAERLAAELDALPPRDARRRWREVQAVATLVAERRPARPVAVRYGLVDLVERARDAYLAELDADDGLAVLAIGWDVVVATAADRARVSETRRPAPRGSSQSM